MEELTFIVPQKYENIKVENFLRDNCSVSRKLLIAVKKIPNGITSNGKHIRTIDFLKAGDIVKILLPEDELPAEPSNISIQILFEDDSYIVLDKPPNLPVHPSRGHKNDTLANGVAYYLKKKGISSAFRAINRLDRDTSGIVIAAKNSYAASFLSGKTDKEYIAVCQGELYGEGTIDEPIRIKEGHGIQREIGEGGERAITHWRALSTSNGHTLLRIRLETGRTHQIRTHFSCMGYPLAGDDMYGGSREYISRQALHCGKIWFNHPQSKNKVEYTSPIPEDINYLIKYFHLNVDYV